MPSTWLTVCSELPGCPRVAGELHVDVAERLQPGAEPRVVRRTPLATARTRPCRRVSRVMIRSDSPSFCTRSTTASSR